MKPIETLLRSLAEPEASPDPAFKAQLRQDLLMAVRHRNRSGRTTRILAFALAGAVILLGLFVLRPDLVQDIHGRLVPSLNGEATTARWEAVDSRTSQEDLVRQLLLTPRAVNAENPAGSATRNSPKIREVLHEAFYVLRHVELANGERAVLLSEVREPPGARVRMY